MIIEIKNMPNKPGVYKITSPTGKVYIGESSNLKRRCKSYLSANKIKEQRAIYNSILKYGVESHCIEILEFCELELLKERERFYQEKYNSVECGLNCFLTKTKDKSKEHSIETKRIMSEKSKGENNPFYGKKHSDESLRMISENSKGKNNPNYGGKLKNEDWLKKQSISNSKKPIKVTDIYTDEVLYFINSKECAFALNAKPSNVRSCKNKYKLKKRYIVESVDIV